MMTVQRYSQPTDELPSMDSNGPWVSYDDHVAALAQARGPLVAANWNEVYEEGKRKGYEQGQLDEMTKWKRLITDRISDLQSCGKPDDCMGKADILLVILDDYNYLQREGKWDE
jgi:hypothetical protein